VPLGLTNVPAGETEIVSTETLALAVAFKLATVAPIV
jgi:hypothetical protein